MACQQTAAGGPETEGGSASGPPRAPVPPVQAGCRARQLRLALPVQEVRAQV